VLTSYSLYRAEDEARWLRLAAIGLILLVAIGNLITLCLLVDGLLQWPVLNRPAVTGLPLCCAISSWSALGPPRIASVLLNDCAAAGVWNAAANAARANAHKVRRATDLSMPALVAGQGKGTAKDHG
jgi:hypothetical protein